MPAEDSFGVLKSASFDLGTEPGSGDNAAGSLARFTGSAVPRRFRFTRNCADVAPATKEVAQSTNT